MQARERQNRSQAQIAATARLFSAAVVQELARNGQSPLFGRLVRESILTASVDATSTVASLFDHAFRILKQKVHRHEYVYKAAIAQRILMGRHNLRTAAMLSEFRAGPCKVDVAILNGTSTAYEIKSERDRLDRLPDQLQAYLRMFAQVYVVTGQNHHDAVLRIAPNEVGVLILTDRYQLHTVRSALCDPNRLDASLVFDSLRSDEIRRILELNDVTLPFVPNTLERRTLRTEFLRLSPLQVQSSMVQVLRQTRGQSALRRLIAASPQSLWAAICTTPIRKQDEDRLLSALQTNAGIALTWA